MVDDDRRGQRSEEAPQLGQIDRLLDAGLDFVKLDSSITMGVAVDAGRFAYVSGVVALLHSVSIDVYAEGVNDAADATALRELGIDAIAGNAAQTAPQVELA